MVTIEPTAVPLVCLFLVLVGRGKAAIPFALALLLAAVINMWSVVPGLEEWAGGVFPKTLGHPVVRYVGNATVAKRAVMET